MCAINISVATSQFSHCYLYSGTRKNVGHYFLGNLRTSEFVFCSDCSIRGDTKKDETSGKYVINGVNSSRCKRLTTEAQGTVFLEDTYADVSII
jgi:hypothetical protein